MTAFRDEDAALIEQRAQLLAARRTSEARLAARARLFARRVTRACWGAASVAAMLVLLALDMLGPEAIATPDGVTPLGGSLTLAPLAFLVVLLARPGLARRSTFVTTSDVRADIDRLREPTPPARPRSGPAVTASFALPLATLALWPPMIVLHGAIDLVRAPLRYYEMMPGLIERRMDAPQALAQLLAGGALLTIFSTIAYAIAIWQAVASPAPWARAPRAFSRLFGGIFFGAFLGQLTSAWMEEGAVSIALGYASLALGALVGVLGWGALFQRVARAREREQNEDEG